MIRLAWCRWTLLGLIILQPLWLGWWSPPSSVPLIAVVALTMAPLLLVFPGSWRLQARTLVVAGTLLTVYFSVGVMEAWASAEARIPALIQVVLCSGFFMGLATIRRPRASSD